MQTSQEDALLLLRKWQDEQTPVICTAKINKVEFAVIGHVAVTDAGIEAKTSDAKGRLVLPFVPGLLWAYEERAELSRHISVVIQENSCLIAIFPDLSRVGFTEWFADYKWPTTKR
jgi:hypothetical protein